MVNVDANTLCYDGTYIILYKNTSDSTKKFSQTDIINMLEFLIETIFAIFDRRVLSPDSRHTYGYKMFLFGVRLHTGVSKNKQNKLARCFNFTFR